jgi:hypothetical protein
VAKLVWRVKLVAELEPGLTTEVEVAHLERDQQAGLAELGLRLAEAKQLTAAIQAEMVPAQVSATLRTKSRVANRAAETAAMRMAELEDQVARLEKQTPPPAQLSAPPPAKRGRKPATPVRSKRRRRDIDPDEAASPGAAGAEPATLDEAGETTMENLQANLKSE